MASAGGGQAVLVGLHVVVPEFSLRNVGQAELPVLVGFVDAIKKALALFFLGQVQKELDDPRAVAAEMVLHVDDGSIALLPDRLLVEQLARQAFAAEDLRMHANDQHFLVIGSIEDADAAALRQALVAAPEKIVFEFRGARMFETENLASLRIDAGHHVLDRAVFAGRVHRLENQQQCMTVSRVLKLLHRAQLRNVLRQQFVILLSGAVYRLYDGRPLFEFDLAALMHAEIFRVDFNINTFASSGCVGRRSPLGQELRDPESLE